MVCGRKEGWGVNLVKNDKCDNEYCMESNGEVRVLPIGEDGNLFLCRTCFRHEMSFRREQNGTVPGITPWSIPKWKSLAIHHAGAGVKIGRKTWQDLIIGGSNAL